MSTNSIPFLKNSYLAELRIAAQNGGPLPQYTEVENFVLDEERLFRQSRVIPTGNIPQLILGSDSSNDAENSIRLHTFLCELTPMQASDQRLWCYLTHSIFFEYTKSRFPFGSNEISNNILSRWFLSKGLDRNAVCRLWWAAAMTCAPWSIDPSLESFRKDDPYHYTRILLSNQDLFQSLVERKFGRCRTTLTVTLDVIDEVRTKTTSPNTFYRKFIKDLNLVSKHSDLGVVDAQMLRRTLLDVANRTLNDQVTSPE